MPGPVIPQNSGKEFYNPGGSADEYDRIQRQPGLPSVPPPSGDTLGAPPPPAMVASQPVDPNAPDILQLIQGGKFDPPFTVTIKRRAGVQVFKSDAGIKQESAYEICKETLRTPSDLLRIAAGMGTEVYKPLNSMTLEFQLMLYLAYKNKALDVPAQPIPSQKVQEVAGADVEAEVEVEVTAETL